MTDRADEGNAPAGERLLGGGANAVLAELLTRVPGDTPEWQPAPNSDWSAARGAGSALARVVARYMDVLGQRFAQAPAKRELAFLGLRGVQLVAATSSQAPVTFRLQDKSPDTRVPAGTRLTASAGAGQAQPASFETVADVAVSASKLAEVRSFWPGRDQYIDHSADLAAGLPFHPFRRADLLDTPHSLYIAHDQLLALSGQVILIVDVEFSTPGSDILDLIWEYWDGQVWRTFKDLGPPCAQGQQTGKDGTQGFTRNGPVVLQTDFAETGQTAVNGITSHWIRARLNIPLPAGGSQVLSATASRLDPSQLVEGTRILPEISYIDLSLQIQRPLPASSSAATGFDLRLMSWGDGSGVPTSGNNLVILGIDSNGLLHIRIYDAAGNRITDTDETKLPATQAAAIATLKHQLPGLLSRHVLTDAEKAQVIGAARRASQDLNVPDPNEPEPIDGKSVPDQGLPLDQAFADRLKLDVSKTFSPFGPQPQPGSTFYWMLEEAMTKPGAVVTLELSPARTPQHVSIASLKVDPTPPPAELTVIRSRTPLEPVLVWEYWDGRQWSPLQVARLDDHDQIVPDPPETSGGQPAWGDLFVPSDYDKSQDQPIPPQRISFRVPSDVAVTKVNDVDGRWIRVRLVSGGFGVIYTVTNTAPAQVNASVIIDPPALQDMRVGYVWQFGPFPPERVLTYNDFRYTDVTEKALWQGLTFAPFIPPSETTPALYLGFDKPQPEDALGFYFDVVEDPQDDLGPPLAWEYWDGFNWDELPSVDDQTRHLRVPGLVNLLGPSDSAALDRFGTPRHWIRARLREDGPPGEPTLAGIYPNSVNCLQRETIVGEPLGAGDGRPNLIVNFRRVPVLAGEFIEVREVAGARAEVEWRIIARQVSGGKETVISGLEKQLAAEGTNLPDPEAGGVRLRRDRLKRVIEVWVRWSAQPHLLDSGPDDRHYVVDRSRGVIQFGDGDHGRVPPAGSAIQARRYQTGGGSAGNVPAGAISQVAGAIGGLDKVWNIKAAEGGADGETIEQARARGPESLRHGGRALLPADYEALARESTAAVARAWALANRDLSGRTAPRPGGVTVQVLPRNDETVDQPWPPFGLREEVRLYLLARAPASLAAGDRISVTGPVYYPVDVEATLAPRLTTDAGTMLDSVKAALKRFLHPVVGGPDGQGWPPERDLFASDLAAVLEEVDKLDHIQELSLLVNGIVQGDRVQVPNGSIIAAGNFTLKLAPAAITEGQS